MFKVVTHSQHFHIDELMAIAMLEHFVFKKEKYELIRTRDNAIIRKAQGEKDTFVVDVGYVFDESMRNFDHHQNDNSLCWSDGLPYSSCGLVWKWLKQEGKLKYMKEGNLVDMPTDTIDMIEKKLIRKVDMHDNGRSVLSDAIFLILYNRKPDDPKAQDSQFKRALKATKDYFVNFVSKIESKGVINHEMNLDTVMAKVLMDVYVVQGSKFENVEVVSNKAFDSEFLKTWNWLRETNQLNQFMNKETMDIIEKDLIVKMNEFIKDGVDNGNYGFLKMYEFKSNPNEKAFRVAKDYYINFFTYVRGNMQAEKDIVKAIKKSEHIPDIVVCDCNIKSAADRVAKLSDKSLVIFPHSNGAWVIQTVPSDLKNTFSQKCPAPKAWLGLKDEELEKVSGIKGLFFCHKGGFITMFKGSLEDATKVARVIFLTNAGLI